MIDEGARIVGPQRWAHRPRLYRAIIWIAYGIVRVGMGVLRYGGNEWFSRRRRAPRPVDQD
jgi:hypothetical protein